MNTPKIASDTNVGRTGLSPRARRAIQKYGFTACETAYAYSERGEGPSTIAAYMGLSGVAAANAAIDAGRELATGIQAGEFDQVYGTVRIGDARQYRTTIRNFLHGRRDGIERVSFIPGDRGNATVTIKYATWTTFLTTLSTAQLDELLRNLPGSVEVTRIA